MPFPPQQSRPTPPPATAQGGMSVPMGPPEQGPPGFGQEGLPQGGAEGIVAILGELEAAGIQIQPGPNGTIVLAGIPAEILAQLGGSTAPPPA